MRSTQPRAFAVALAVATTLILMASILVSSSLSAAEATSSSDTQRLKTIKVETDTADGSSESGYRKDTVSQVGPWQGRTLQELPYSITVIPAELIENVQATNSDQLFRINPTTQLRRSQSENDQSGVNLRGFSSQSFYRDGVPGDQYGHGTTTEDAESIEILTGLSGFLYGPGNVGGVVNYVTKRPTAERRSRFTVGNSGASNVYGSGDFSGSIDVDNRFGYRVNAIWQEGETPVEHQDIDKKFISAAFDWQLTDSLLLQIDGSDRDYLVDGAQAYWALGTNARRPSADSLDTATSYGQHWSSRHYENTKYGARLRWEPSDAVTLRAAWAHNNSVRAIFNTTNTVQANGTFNQTTALSYAAGIDPMLSEQIDKRGQAFADFSFATGTIAHKLTTGVMYSNNLQERFQRNSATLNANGIPLARPTYLARPAPATLDRGNRAPVSDSTAVTYSIGDDVAFNEQWSLLAGVGRVTIDDANITNVFVSPGYKKSAVTPTVSLVFKPSEVITTYASYIESLERGSAAGDEFNGARVVNAGQVFEPLTSEQFEVGAKVSLGGVLLTTALFQIDKALQYYDISNPASPRFVQDGRQVHRGIEFTAVGKLTADLALIGGFTLLDAQVQEQEQQPALEGKRPINVAERLVKLHLEYQLPSLPALTFSGGANYNSDQYGDALNIDRMPAYTLFDIGARYAASMGSSLLTLRLDAYNVTDKHYWANNGYLGDPRSIALSASVEF